MESYGDQASGRLETRADGSGQITEVTLRPRIQVSAGDLSQIPALHRRANQLCFIANSVNFPVHHELHTESSALH